MGFCRAYDNPHRCIKIETDNSPPGYKPIGWYGLYSVVFTCFSDHAEDDEDQEPDFRPGRDWHFLIRISISAASEDYAHNISFDTWVGPSSSTDSMGVGATIDEKNTVLVPPENNVPIMINLRALNSQMPNQSIADGASSTHCLFNGCSVLIERVCCCKFKVFFLPPLAVAMMRIAELQNYAFAHMEGKPKMSVPSFVPKKPASKAVKKREREDKEVARQKRIATRRSTVACAAAEASDAALEEVSASTAASASAS